MYRLLRLMLLVCLAVSIPVQGMAAARMQLGQADAHSSHLSPHEACAHAEAPAADAVATDIRQSAVERRIVDQIAVDQSVVDQSAAHCAVCCSPAAIIVEPVVPGADGLSEARHAQPGPAWASFIDAGLERPPSPALLIA